jgi:hypothetical protein
MALKYAYACPSCGIIESDVPADGITCLECGQPARRVWQVAFDRQSTKQSGRWDPQVGQYVANDREFRELLRAGAERQERELGMEVPLAVVDARDDQARGELHGVGVDHIHEVREETAKKLHDEKVTANKEQKPKVLTHG